eukprot:m.102119 g.102119  ORF g.102119 m.102119 type:complete len:527 (+) comp15494_c0_seq1:318-1898(+)
MPKRSVDTDDAPAAAGPGKRPRDADSRDAPHPPLQIVKHIKHSLLAVPDETQATAHTSSPQAAPTDNDIVRAIYDAADAPLAPVRLQKLLFFAYGIAAAVFDQRLLEDEFKAWKCGPVARGVWHQYRGWNPLPCRAPKSSQPLPRSLSLAVQLAVATHAHDTNAKLKELSLIPLWEKLHSTCNQTMPFKDIKAYFQQPARLLSEVVPALLLKPRLFSTDTDDLLSSMAKSLLQMSSTRKYVNDHVHAMFDLEAARSLAPHLVRWPGQTPLDALIVAFNAVPHLYNVFATDLSEGTEEHLQSLADLASLGDWVALQRLSNYLDLDGRLDHLPVNDLAETTHPRNLYAYGTFMYLRGDEDAAKANWEQSNTNEARIAIATTGDTPCEELAKLVVQNGVEAARPYSFFFSCNLDGWEDTDEPQAVFLRGLLAARQGNRSLSWQLMYTLALAKNHERACQALFDLFPDADQYECDALKKLARAGNQCAMVCFNKHFEGTFELDRLHRTDKDRQDLCDQLLADVCDGLLCE